jgi:DNA adenine methylase
MILTRPGNKRKLAVDIYQYFPEHKLRITLFFGAGGMFFYTPKAKYNIVNDLDDDVTNLFLVVLNQKEELTRLLEQMPISQSLFKYWKDNQETDPVKKAIRFLLLSNFSYLGKAGTMRLGLDNTKELLLERIEPTFKALNSTKILTSDFREVIPQISFSKKLVTKDDSFLYLDPVYLGKEHTYKIPKWTKDDTIDCLDIMKNEGIRAAMSEFKTKFVVEEAKKRGFCIVPVKGRQSVKNRNQEILITNYFPQNLLFDYDI